ncbi:MAG: hypothetical protein WD851_14815 [Pirellulales bacterium]
MSQQTLHKEIIARSESDNWDDARDEWALGNVWMSDDPSTCLCGHNPIKEICEIKNRLNNKEVEVGNCCVNNFLGLESDQLFTSLRRVVADDEASFNPDAINFAHSRGFISDWDHKFYLSIWRKRNLSTKQFANKYRINKKLLSHLVR